MTTEIESPPRPEPLTMASAFGSSEEHPGGRIRGLDALRGFAAFGVTLFHLTSQYDQSYHFQVPPTVSFPFGAHGVTLFFVISGFVIFMTLERTSRPRDFVVARFSRLYPTYWAAVILSTSALLMWPLPGTEAPAKLLAKAAINLTMLQRWFRVGSIDPVYWTLEVELCFYVLMFLLLCGKALNRAVAAFTVLALLAVADQLLIPQGTSPWMDRLRGLLILKYVHIFLMGMLIYKFRSTRKVLYALLLPACLIYPAIRGMSTHTWSDAAFVAGSGGLVGLATTRPMRFLEFPLLQFLGKISYSLYLVHYVIGTIVIRRLIGAGVSTDLAITAALILVTAIATSLTFLVERPAMRMIRRARDRRADTRLSLA